MKLKALDHVNIITDDLQASAAFYRDLLGLDIRPGPPPLKPEWVLWLYDDAGRAVVHLNHADMPKTVERDLSGPKTGVLHHVAFECEGFEEMHSDLEMRQAAFHVSELPAISLKQIFIEDPNGVLLELNFREG
ncbi:MAG: VOC family protein [Pseudomonadota bacterium]